MPSNQKVGAGSERRQFARVSFLTSAVLVVAGRALTASIVDLSFKGALVKLESASEVPDVGTPCELEIVLSPEVSINMHVHVAHRRDGMIGVRCDHLDIDSMQHLRRLVELNLGDSDLLDRELAALTQL